MVSTVMARKRPGAGVAEIVAALFPCGSVTGAPKLRAMEILRELESSPRGAYCGAVGHFSPDGSARFNVAIRTLTITGGRGELGIGGGVVQDSVAASEYAECLLKARFFAAARRPLELIETFRFENGFVRLDAHLARMKNSADAFGLKFEADTARQAVERATAGTQARNVCASPWMNMGSTGPPSRRSLPLLVAGPMPFLQPGFTAAICFNGTRRTGAIFMSARRRGWAPMKCCSSTSAANSLRARAAMSFVMKADGILHTPPLSAGAQPGIQRAALIARGAAQEARLMPDDLGKGKVLFGNSLRGLIPAA